MGYTVWMFVILVAILSVVVIYALKRIGDIAGHRRTKNAIREAGEPETEAIMPKQNNLTPDKD